MRPETFLSLIAIAVIALSATFYLQKPECPAGSVAMSVWWSWHCFVEVPFK
jgi:hypothetical protein